MTLIAVKREVAAYLKKQVFPWSECQVKENWRQVTVQNSRIVRFEEDSPGGKRVMPNVTHTEMCTVTACRTDY